MRVAIFSDVHGNLTALEAVLRDIDEQDADEIVFAGDLCLGGPRPHECLDRIRRRDDIAAIYGNTDESIEGMPLLSEDIEEEARARHQHMSSVVSWTRERLNEMERAWLRELPFHRRISPSVQPRDDLFIVHANPIDVTQVIFPPENLQKEFLGKVEQSNDDLYSLLEGLVAGVVAFGHLHIPSVRQWNDLTLVNVSSVSMPADGDMRAKYALLEWDGEQWQIEHHRVEYDVESEVHAYRSAKPPGWEEAVKTLESGA